MFCNGWDLTRCSLWQWRRATLRRYGWLGFISRSEIRFFAFAVRPATRPLFGLPDYLTIFAVAAVAGLLNFAGGFAGFVGVFVFGGVGDFFGSS